MSTQIAWSDLIRQAITEEAQRDRLLATKDATTPMFTEAGRHSIRAEAFREAAVIVERAPR